MTYRLKPGITFCQVAGRTMFLDLPRDRYFCLSPSAEQSFVRLLSRSGLNAEDAANLDALARRGPLTRSAGAPLAACRPARPVTESLLDAPAPAVARGELLRCAVALLAADLHLRIFGLARAIGRIDLRKAKAVAMPHREGRLAAVATAFARLRHVATTHDRCLPRSLAVARRLLAAGAVPELVIGVKLEPFAAHAWVQCDGWLVNDRVDVVRDFTPIRIV